MLFPSARDRARRCRCRRSPEADGRALLRAVLGWRRAVLRRALAPRRLPRWLPRIDQPAGGHAGPDDQRPSLKRSGFRFTRQLAYADGGRDTRGRGMQSLGDVLSRS